MNSFFRAALLMGMILSCARAFAADAEELRFGPYNAAAQKGFAAADEQAAANHQWKTNREDGRVQVLVTPEFFTETEAGAGVPAVIAEAHDAWKYSQEAMVSDDVQWTESGSLSSSSVMLDGETPQVVRRDYRWVPRHRMVLVVEARAAQAEAGDLDAVLEQAADAVSIEENFEVSPCVKTYYMGRRFNGILKAQEKGLPEATAYAANLKAGLAGEVEEHARHCWSHFYLLAYMESFDAEGRFLPEGHPREAAQQYLDRAWEVRPDDQGSGLRLEDLPDLWSGPAAL